MRNICQKKNCRGKSKIKKRKITRTGIDVTGLSRRGEKRREGWWCVIEKEVRKKKRKRVGKVVIQIEIFCYHFLWFQSSFIYYFILIIIILRIRWNGNRKIIATEINETAMLRIIECFLFIYYVFPDFHFLWHIILKTKISFSCHFCKFFAWSYESFDFNDFIYDGAKTQQEKMKS